MIQLLGFDAFERGSDGYEPARRATVWNGRVPERYPDIIVRPETDHDVVAAVRYAIARGLRIGVRSGGHSWNASFLRDGGMLIDMANMTRISLSVDTGIAYAEPAAHGGDLNTMLVAHGLMFPSGHCPSVGIGGFLLQGGFGWNSRKWGVGAENVVGVDVVTAAGELVHADADTHSDLYWAARGAGPGFFGVVTRFHLKTHPLPRAMMTSSYIYPVDALDELLTWLDDLQPRLPADLEVSMTVIRDDDDNSTVMLALTGDALCESTTAAHRALALLEESPVLGRALSRDVMNPVSLDGLLQRFEDLLDSAGRRYHVDNSWTSAPAAQLLPTIHTIIEQLPPPPSHLYLLWWGPARPLDDMAFSMQGRLFLSLYAISDDPSQDDQLRQLVTAGMRALEPWADGIQLADENLDDRPFKFMAASHFARLEQARSAYDPDRRFHSYMRIPESTGVR